jgi:hypothetical protein
MKITHYQPYNFYKNGFYIDDDDNVGRLLMMSDDDFINHSLSEIENEALEHGFIIKKYIGNEYDKILKFIEKNYPTDIAEKSMFYFYPFLHYGFTIVAEFDGNIAGCMLNSGFQSISNINFSQRLMVDQNMRNRHIGELIVRYCFLIAFHNKANYNSGVIRLNNQPSLQLALNKLGMVINNIETLLNIQFVNVSIPLRKQNLVNSIIDLEKVNQYINSSKSEFDYQLIQQTDYEGIKKAYQQGFIVIALLKAGTVNDSNQLFAIPKTMISE